MLDSNLKLLVKFNSSLFYEDVSQGFLSVRGTNLSPLVVNNEVYKMEENQYLYGEGPSQLGLSLDVTSSFTLGFWLYSISPGLVVNNIGEAESITMPIFDFNDDSSSNKSIIKISEKSFDNDYNKMVLSLDGENYVAVSEEYDVDTWHCFWITYDGDSNTVNIYVDGKSMTLSETGSIPTSIAGNGLFLYVNHSVNGYDYNLSKNYGFVSDLFLFNTVLDQETSMQKFINDGIDYITNSNLSDVVIENFCFHFDDPVTTTITSSVGETGFVCVGRDDGSILKGSPLFWETRHVFSDDNIDGGSGVLQIKNSTLRF